MNLQIHRVEKCMEWLEEGITDPAATQSIPLLIERMNLLCTSLAFVNNQMAIAKLRLNEAKVRSYAAMGVKQHGLSPMLAKDLVAAQCGKEQYDYDLCERTSRTIVHSVDGLRTCISALKADLQYMSSAA